MTKSRWSLSEDETEAVEEDGFMMCKICTTFYVPAFGDVPMDVDPGTPFWDLPDDWTCPGCSAPKASFSTLANTRSSVVETRLRDLRLDAREELFRKPMSETPLNRAISISCEGFRDLNGHLVGILYSPLCLSIVILPGGKLGYVDDLRQGIIAGFPSGDYEFVRMVGPRTGSYFVSTLFADMSEFSDDAQASRVARAVLSELFEPTRIEEEDFDDFETLLDTDVEVPAPSFDFRNSGVQRNGVVGRC